MIPVTFGTLLILAIDIGTAAEEYVTSEWMMTVACLVYNIAIGMPHLYRRNRIAFAFGMLYYIIKVYYQYGKVPPILVMSV